MLKNVTKPGAFYVIDGTDGSGKATQTRLLVERLRSEGHDVETISFPQYGRHSCTMVEAYLSGRYVRNALDWNSKAASILYAVDRFDASFQIREWIQSGKTVVADRYVASNMGHQGSKIIDPMQRSEYLRWNDHLEHEIFGIPRPDVNIVLCVPTDIAQKLAHQGAKEKTKVGGDIHEADIEHLRAAEATYREIANSFPQFALIECIENDELRSRESIHEDVWTAATSARTSTESLETQTPAIA